MSLPRRARGFSLLEALIASLILAIAMVALFQLWSYNFASLQRSREVSQAGQIARAEMEWAKAYGARKLPTGTYSTATEIGTWNGSYDQTANSGSGGWVTGASSYYDITGARVADATTDGVRYRVSTQFQDQTVLIGTGQSYEIDITSLRAAVVTVRRLPEDTVIFSLASNLVVGGL